MLSVLRDRSYFFDEGICFECLRCGSCCTGEPGVVFVEEAEKTTIADFLGISRQVFIERCLFPIGDRLSIRETDDFRCIFYENGCSIYPVRPLQCRTFPFWAQNFRSKKAWNETLRRCPGIGTGRRYTKNEILDLITCSMHLFEDVSAMTVSGEDAHGSSGMECADSGITWNVYRQDDNGHTFLVSVHGSRSEALRRLRAFERKTHKQVFWVEQTPKEQESKRR